MKNRIKIMIASIIAFAIVAISVTSVYAYYKIKNSKDISLGTNITDEEVVAITSFSDLYLASKEGYFNSKNEISTSRKILRLSDDLELTNDLEITADIHFDLDGHALTINDKNITIKHGYYGVFAIYGGTIITDDGKIIVDTPNAYVETDELVFENSSSETVEGVIEVVNINQKYTTYAALYYVGKVLDSEINIRPNFELYDAVLADSFELTSDKFIIKKKSCEITDSQEACCFVESDIDLPMHYLTDKIKVSYSVSSSAETLFSPTGNLLRSVDDVESFVLSAIVSYEGWDEALPACDFKIHVVNLDDAPTSLSVGKTIIKTLLQPYYVGEDLQVNSVIELEDYYYSFTHGLTLPLSCFDGQITFEYSATNKAGNATIDTFSYEEEGMYIFEPTSSCYHLVVDINGQENELSLQMYSTYVSNYETYSKKILNELYGGSIIYDASIGSVKLKGANDASLKANVKEMITKYGVTAITYELKEDSLAKTDYVISDGTLTAKSGIIPAAKEEYITVTFSFGLTQIPFDIYVVYITGSGDTNSSFLQYYNQFDPNVPLAIHETHDMPFCYMNGAPYVCYDFAIYSDLKTQVIDGEEYQYYDCSSKAIPDGLTVSLFYDGEVKYTFTNEDTMVNQLNEFMADKDYADIASKDDICYKFGIDRTKISVEDTKIILLYNYSFNGVEWALYKSEIIDSTDAAHHMINELTCSKFTLKGGVVWNNVAGVRTNVVTDESFFVWIYNHLNPEADLLDSETLITTSDVEDKIIVNDWLKQDISLNVTTDAALASITDFTGVTNLAGAKYVNLTGKNLSGIASQIANMTSVETLVLSSCSLTTVAEFKTMSSVKVLYIDTNSISTFDELLEMDSLESVYLYSNTGSSSYYGSKGICNYQIFDDLRMNGVNVYNEVNANGVAILFENATENNDYWKLKNIEYQSILSSAVSITKLYEKFSVLTANDIGLKSNTTGTLVWAYESGKNAYNATYFYVTYNISATVQLKVKYYVDRY